MVRQPEVVPHSFALLRHNPDHLWRALSSSTSIWNVHFPVFTFVLNLWRAHFLPMRIIDKWCAYYARSVICYCDVICNELTDNRNWFWKRVNEGSGRTDLYFRSTYHLSQMSAIENSLLLHGSTVVYIKSFGEVNLTLDLHWYHTSTCNRPCPYYRPPSLMQFVYGAH